MSARLMLGGPVFVDSKDPRVVAGAHREAGYRAGYLALDLAPVDTAGIRAVRDAFAAEDVVIAEVPAFGVSLLGDDAAAVGQAEKTVTERLAVADELGALCAVNIIGSYSTDSWYAPHPRNFSPGARDQAVETARKIVDSVRPKRAKLTYELMSFNFLDTPQAYVDFLAAVDRPSVGVHLDPVNCICSPRTLFCFSSILDDAFRLLGPRIVSCHAKDMRLRPGPVSPQLEEVRPGTGSVDYREFLSHLGALGRDVPLIMEHLPDQAEYFAARDYITGVARGLGMT